MSGQGDPENKAKALAMLGENGELEALRQKVKAGSDEWAQAMSDQATRAGEDALDAGTAARVQFTLFALAAFVGTAFLGITTVLRVIRPVQQMQDSVRSIAAGNFDTAVAHTTSSDELGELARAIEVLPAVGRRDRGSELVQGRRRRRDRRHPTRRHASRSSVSERSRVSPPDWRRRRSLLPPRPGHAATRADLGARNRGASRGEVAQGGRGTIGRAARDSQPVFHGETAGAEYVRVGARASAGPRARTWWRGPSSRATRWSASSSSGRRGRSRRERELLAELGPLVGLSMEIIRGTCGSRKPSSGTGASCQSAPDGMIVLEHDGKITLANQRMRELFGYAAEELVGGTWGCSFRGRRRQHNLQLVQRFFRHSMAAGRGWRRRRRASRARTRTAGRSPSRSRWRRCRPQGEARRPRRRRSATRHDSKRKRRSSARATSPRRRRR